jgi:hypothetical protein
MPEGRDLNSISKIMGNAAKRQESLINRIKVNAYHLYPPYSQLYYTKPLAARLRFELLLQTHISGVVPNETRKDKKHSLVEWTHWIGEK